MILKEFLMQSPSEQLVEFMTRIYNLQLTTPSGGNLSIKDDENCLWVTPSQIDKGCLKAEDIVKIFPDNKIEGKHKPTMEYQFHQGIYKERNDINAVTHAHPTGLVAFSMIENKPQFNNLPALTDKIRTIGFAPYAIPGSAELGSCISNTFSNGYNAIFMENHGIITTGKNLPEAFYRMENLETIANIYIQAMQTDTVNSLSKAELELSESHLQKRFPEFEHTIVNQHEKELRNELCTISLRSYNRKLITASAGCYSVRLDSNSFLIMPEIGDPEYQTPDDMVLMKNGNAEKGKIPSRYADLHLAIYNKHPEISAITCAHPIYLMAFAITNKEFDSRTIPESFLFLNSIPRIPFSVRYHNVVSIAENLTNQIQCILISNECFLATGKSLFQVFDRLEVAEFTARSIIDSQPLGLIKPISQADIDDLTEKFMS